LQLLVRLGAGTDGRIDEAVAAPDAEGAVEPEVVLRADDERIARHQGDLDVSGAAGNADGILAVDEDRNRLAGTDDGRRDDESQQ
jgi:hypothetical protein